MFSVSEKKPQAFKVKTHTGTLREMSTTLETLHPGACVNTVTFTAKNKREKQTKNTSDLSVLTAQNVCDKKKQQNIYIPTSEDILQT